MSGSHGHRNLSFPYRTQSASTDDPESSRRQIGLRTLNDPTDPYIELIFVHGLMGDALLTWMIENDRATFWPEWLLEEIPLANVRIHTYGYNEFLSNGRAPVSRLRQIGEGLCSALELNNQIRSDAHNPIIFIAHSLGGLVVKAAITHARTNAKFHDLGRRFHTILFLATPHRDAEDREMLVRIIRACNTSSSRFDIIEPDPNTAVAQAINSEFSPHLNDLKMWSFYESSNDPVVAKRCATLNVSQERDLLRVNADHAGIVKFRDSGDPAYVAIKEILLALVDEIQEELRNPERVEDQMRTLTQYLNALDTEDEEFSRKEYHKVPNTCEWLIQKDEFKHWRDKTGPRGVKWNQIFWLRGDPGCGKSFVAAHVISHLRNLNAKPSFYFFKHGDLTKQSMTGLLKSIVLQMARHSAGLRRSLLSMQRENAFTAEPNDLRAVWKQLFVQRAFRTSLDQQQYWIIDAVDEGHGYRELIGLFQPLPEGFSVFITSRKDKDLTKELRILDARVTTYDIEVADSISDIRSYLEYNDEDLHVEEGPEMQSLIQRIVNKSRGSFLWTHLILQELSNYWMDKDIDAVLDNVPAELQQAYSRILKKIAQTPNGELAKLILLWVVCAIQPMTVASMRTAIRLETNQTLKLPVKAIQLICEPLINIENSRLELVHDTVRDYLFNKDRRRTSEVVEGFSFDKAVSHERLAIVCVSFLASYFRAPTRTTISDRARDAEDDAFLDYASRNFSEHAVKSTSAPETNSTKKLVLAILDFFSGPFLFWTERQASAARLSELYRAGKNLKAFVTKRAGDHSLYNKQLQELHEWANDLIHLVTVFGRDLLKEPAAIHTIIPPLCPSQSKISQHLQNPGVGLQVVGRSRSAWTDRISSVSYGREFTTALACCDRFYAVGLRSKTDQQIILYFDSTCQEARRIKIPEPAKQMEFARSKHWVIAGGRSTLSMYDYDTGETIWSVSTESEILALTTDEHDSRILAVTRERNFETYNTNNGERIVCQALEYVRPKSPNLPVRAYISDETRLIILIHRNSELELYDMHSLKRSKRRVGFTTNVDALVLNPTFNTLTMGSYDGELRTIELSSMHEQRKVDANAAQLAVSTDGRTLIMGLNSGEIQICHSETLLPFHIIHYEDEEVVGLRFTSKNLRFLDIRPHQMNVWEPAALVRRGDEEDSGSSDLISLSDFASAASQPVEPSISDRFAISALVEHHSGDFVFCAKENGAIAVYDTREGKPKQKLFEFGKTLVHFMAWNEARGLLATADNSGTVKLHGVHRTEERTLSGPKYHWHAKEIGQRKLLQPVRQIILSLDGDYLLVSTTTDESVWTTNSKLEKVLTHSCTATFSTAERSQKWVTFPRRKRRFLEVQRHERHTITWDDGSKPRIASSQSTDLTPSESSPHANNVYLVRIDESLWGAYDNNPYTPPLIFRPSSVVTSAEQTEALAAQTLREFDKIAGQVDTFLGIYRGRLIFLSSEYWVCSLRIDRAGLDDPIRPLFPFPHCWRTSHRPLRALVTSNGDVAFAVEGDLVIVKHGLG